MIQLTEKISGGMERDVYLHPRNDGLLVKIHRALGNRKNINDAEYGYYINYIRNSDSSIYFSEIFGWEDTNLGRGLLVECIRDNDGRISRPLSDLVRENEIRYSDAREKIEFIATILKKDGIIFRGLHADNILVRRNKIQNEFDIVIVDGFGAVKHNLITSAQLHVNFLRREKARRSWNRQIAFLDAQMDLDNKWIIICDKYPSVIDNYNELNDYHPDIAKAYKKGVVLALPQKFRSLQKEYDRLKKSVVSSFLRVKFGSDQSIIEFGSWCLRNNHDRAVDDLHIALNSSENKTCADDIIENIIKKYDLIEYRHSRN